MRWIQSKIATSALQSWRAGLRVLLLMACASAVVAESEGPVQWTHDGLELVPDTKVMAAWVKPGVDFSVYDRVMILEAAVAFRKNWQQDQNRNSVHRITNRDVQRIKEEMAKLFYEVFVEELSSDGGFDVVDVPDTDVLLLRPAIVDLDITAPESRGTGRSYNFASSAGAATLFIELYDSVSGEILARALDRQSTNHPGDVMRLSNTVTNRAEAERILAGWAKLLRRSLDELHGAPSQGEQPEG